MGHPNIPTPAKEAGMGHPNIPTPAKEAGMGHPNIPTPAKEAGMGHPNIPTPAKEAGMGHPNIPSPAKEAGIGHPNIPTPAKEAGMGHPNIPTPAKEAGMGHPNIPTPAKEAGMGHPNIPTPAKEAGMGHPNIPTPAKEAGMGHPGSIPTTSMRLFVALDIEPAIRDRITTFRDEMRALAPTGVRWVSPETFHLTLQFLGETPKVEAIKTALATIKAEPTTVTFRSAGFFPNANRARVFWVGIEPDERLPHLVNEVGAALAPLGFKRETDEYHPHLTLARAGSGRPHARPGDKAAPGLQQVRGRVESMPLPEFGTMTATEFILYQSTLTPTGSRYSNLQRYRLS